MGLVALAALSLTACATGGGGKPRPHAAAAGYKIGKPYQVRGVWYTPSEQPRYNEVGIGSWYGEQFHNRYTANGEVFDMDIPSAAHKTLPLPSLVEVTNLQNGRRAIVRVNDRGPFVDGRIIDLSKAAADQLGYRNQGVAQVRVRYVGPAPLSGAPRQYQVRQTPVRPAAPRALAAVGTGPGWLPQPQYLADSPVPRSRPAPPAGVTPILQSSVAPVAVTGDYQVQAGAFSVRANAERALAQVSGAGQAWIVETPREGGVLYRVMVRGGDAMGLRDQVASLGYPDARVISGQ